MKMKGKLLKCVGKISCKLKRNRKGNKSKPELGSKKTNTPGERGSQIARKHDLNTSQIATKDPSEPRQSEATMPE